MCVSSEKEQLCLNREFGHRAKLLSVGGGGGGEPGGADCVSDSKHTGGKHIFGVTSQFRDGG